MKIKKGDWKIETSSFISLEWRNSIPRLILHEKYENKVKWVLRVLTFVGIATSLITLEWYQGVILSILLLLIEQFFERTIFEYTTIIFQSLPNFEIDGKRWKTMAFAFPENPDDLPFMGPAFDSEEYARNLFEYIKSWNNIDGDDAENKIIVSFIMEPNSTYTFFIYANPQREELREKFGQIEEKRKYEKYGKRHQQLFMQVTLAHNFEYKDGLMVDKFLKTYNQNEPFYFTPYFHNSEANQLKVLNTLSIKKYQYKIKKRSELTKNDHEYYTKILK